MPEPSPHPPPCPLGQLAVELISLVSSTHLLLLSGFATSDQIASKILFNWAIVEDMNKCPDQAFQIINRHIADSAFADALPLTAQCLPPDTALASSFDFSTLFEEATKNGFVFDAWRFALRLSWHLKRM